MKWKSLCSALLITIGLFCIIGIVMFLTDLFPWFYVAIIFIAIFLLIYNSMTRERYDSDNDRMQWFSNDENEEDEK
jgi:cell division protein FtsW (lipid II flippase)